MALATELLSVLENDEEPLPKRLRIAISAFSSNELPSLNKESVILEWLSNTGNKQDDTDIWNKLNSCLNSQYIGQLRSNEIKVDVLSNIITTIQNRLQQNLNNDLKQAIVECSITILKNDIFQQYFRHDMKQYCIFISILLLHIDDKSILNVLINSNLLFNKKVTVKIDYSNYFLSHVMNTLIDMLNKVEENEFFNGVVYLIQKALFPVNSKTFLNYLNDVFDENLNNTNSVSNDVINILIDMYKYDEQKASLSFKTIFEAFITSHKSETIYIYKFLVLIIQLVGFQVNEKFHIEISKTIENPNLNKSITIISDLIEMISKGNIVILDKINSVSYSEFLTFLLTSIIRIRSKPNANILNIIKYVITTDPLVVENSVSELLIYLTMFANNEDEHLYSNLLVFLFDMYLKLHRIHKFCSEFLRSMQNALFLNYTFEEPTFKFISEEQIIECIPSIQEICSEKVLTHFQECIVLQSNKQVISIGRTFINSLKEIVSHLDEYIEDTNKILYMQIVCSLTCQFLTAVRIAEHTTTDITIGKFLKDMDSFMDILKQFGKAILKMEHNHSLMFSFLNLCYTWGEAIIVLSYYIGNNKDIIKGDIGTNFSVNNLTYLHHYLTTEQWSLISQRIKNFGEQPCKFILQKLIIQKLRAVILFESEINNKIESSIITNFSANIENCWELIFTDPFVVSKFISNMENSQIILLANLLISDMLKKNLNTLKIHSAVDCRDLDLSIIYVSLSKISNLFKRKRKHNDKITMKPLNLKIFQDIDMDMFIRNKISFNETMIDLFSDHNTNEVKIDKMDEERLYCLMEILKHIPVGSLTHDVQFILFLYILSLLIDLKGYQPKNNQCSKLCEKYLIALVENTSSLNIFLNEKCSIFIYYIIEKTENYKDILKLIINLILKQNNAIVEFKSCIKLITKNIFDSKYLNASVIIVYAINKAMKYKLAADSKLTLKKYKTKLCEKLLKHTIIINDNISEDIIEAYVVTLQKYLLEDNKDAVTKLISVLNQYQEFALSNITELNAKGCLLLFELILKHKSSFKDISPNFSLSVWKSCKNLNYNFDYIEILNKTLILVFEHISIEQFPVVLNDLLESVKIYLNNHQLDNIEHQLDIWNNLLNSSLNTAKQKLFHNSLQSFFDYMMFYITNNKNNLKLCAAVIKLQINCIENKQVPLSSSTIDTCFQMTQLIICNNNLENFIIEFDKGFSILETFLKHRKVLLIDRLPVYLMHFRVFLHYLCLNSTTDLNITRIEILKLENCAFRLEQVIKKICTLKTDMARIAPYLIADILKEYEKYALYPDIKNHLNNIFNYLIDLCDTHAISYLLRVLSTPSTEIFKNIHENYKRYYKFTGKV